MSKKRHMDFMLLDTKDSRIKFRFYPRASHMHSFGDKPARTFAGVYKVYYSWGIFRSENCGWDGAEDWRPFREMFRMSIDECSVLFGLDEVLMQLIEHKESGKIMSFGMPGSFWDITYDNGWSWDDEKSMECFDPDYISEEDFKELWERPPKFVFEVWDSGTDRGYRFSLSVLETEKFAKFIGEINQHMLENSEPI